MFSYKNPTIIESPRDTNFNRNLLAQFQVAKNRPNTRKTHYFDGRFENIYLDNEQIPLLGELKLDAKNYAQKILGQPVQKMGCWFNAMGPGQRTTLHRHDEDDELLSGVYYVYVPTNSGALIIHTAEQAIHHRPHAAQWVFFTPQTPHQVEENRSNEIRLSVAFNFS